MAGRRTLYGLVLAGCFIFFLAYQEWLAWFLLVVLAAFPVFSVVASLPAMLTTKLRISAPAAVEQGVPVEPQILHRCPLPAPPWRCKLLVERPLTGERWKKRRLTDPLPVEHCGTLVITLKARIMDYVGLAQLPVRCRPATCQIHVRPQPVPVTDLPSLEMGRQLRWKPKPGGGFSENHELRLYRPGDSIQQIHWKLSAKTGNLILREPMEPVRDRMLVRLDLCGTPQLLDRKLGQLLWVSNQLLEKDLHFHIQALTGQGIELWSVTSRQELEQALDQLLSRRPATEGTLATRSEAACWQYFIGGGGHEA